MFLFVGLLLASCVSFVSAEVNRKDLRCYDYLSPQSVEIYKYIAYKVPLFNGACEASLYADTSNDKSDKDICDTLIWAFINKTSEITFKRLCLERSSSNRSDIHIDPFLKKQIRKQHCKECKALTVAAKDPAFYTTDFEKFKDAQAQAHAESAQPTADAQDDNEGVEPTEDGAPSDDNT